MLCERGKAGNQNHFISFFQRELEGRISEPIPALPFCLPALGRVLVYLGVWSRSGCASRLVGTKHRKVNLPFAYPL
jgi:hypothetical protein